jgi:hypothetical protein
MIVVRSSKWRVRAGVHGQHKSAIDPKRTLGRERKRE